MAVVDSYIQIMDAVSRPGRETKIAVLVVYFWSQAEVC